VNLPDLPHRADVEAAIAAALAGGAVVLDLYHRSSTTTYAKEDGSPVTDADLASDRAIRRVLASRVPNDPILTEEGEDDEARLASRRCWIVDPIDGTEQFIARTGEFDVLVALAVEGRPVAVAGYQPTADTLVFASAGGGAWSRQGEQDPRPIQFERERTAPPRLATSKWFGAPENAALMEAIAARLDVDPGQSVMTGFSPRMFLPPRRFDAMIGIRPGVDQTMASEWDFAVADLVIHEAGGRVTNLAGEPFRYNKLLPRTVGGLVAAANREVHQRILEAAVAVERRKRSIA
jgi:3'-phosphoadenosine 5'-phosphosulfate (PAPS) 3'-phosphatase